MKIKFYKYHGAGNDFVVIDNRKKYFDDSIEVVKFLCDRHLGVGADGLMLLENHNEYDFTMRYFNSDGKEATMCGNGGRCIVAFAKKLGIIDNETHFLAADGTHRATIAESKRDFKVRLQMLDVNLKDWDKFSDFLDTGSPHHIEMVEDVSSVDVNKKGAQIRYSQAYKSRGGVNVNFVQNIAKGKIKIRTYERGVEFETLACGTGATACAIFYGLHNNLNSSTVAVEAVGGELEVSYEIIGNFARHIFLAGPAREVFFGEIEI